MACGTVLEVLQAEGFEIDVAYTSFLKRQWLRNEIGHWIEFASAFSDAGYLGDIIAMAFSKQA